MSGWTDPDNVSKVFYLTIGITFVSNLVLFIFCYMMYIPKDQIRAIYFKVFTKKIKTKYVQEQW